MSTATARTPEVAVDARVNTDKIFNGVFSCSTATYVVFLVIIIGSVLFYTSPEKVLTSLFSHNTLFAIRLSLTTSLIATTMAVLIAIPVGYCLSRYNFKGKALLDTIIDMPIVLPPLVVGMCLLIFFNTVIGRFVEERMMRFVFEVPGIVLAQFCISGSFAIIALREAFDSIDPRYEDAARILGCNKFQAFTKVTFPLVRRGLVSGAVMTWTRAVGEFVPILLLCGAQRDKTTIMPIAIFLQFEVGDIEGAVGLTVLFLLLSFLYLAAMKNFGLVVGGRLRKGQT